MRKSLIAGLAVAASLGGASTASAEPTWAPAASATVHPGRHDVHRRRPVHRRTSSSPTAPTTSTSARPPTARAPAAAPTPTAASTQSLPNGTPVEVTGASQPGTLVYNSWNAMQQAGETDADTCAYNDFALIKLNAADARARSTRRCRRSAARPRIGQTTATLDDVYSYGNSSLRQGITCSRPSAARASAPRAAAGRTSSTPSRRASPATPARGFMDATRAARSASSPRSSSPRWPASNGVSDLPEGARLQRAHGGPDVTLANGTEPFTGSIIG